MRQGLLAVLLVLAPVAAHGGDDDELREAQVHLDRGSDHFRAGRFQQAVEEFRKALAVVEEPNLVWNIARAYEEMGDAPNAVHYFRLFAESWPEHDSASGARERADALRPRLPGWIVPDCGGFAAAKISVDSADPVPCGDRIGPLKPGIHVLEATGPGRRPWKGEVDVAPEVETKVDVLLEVTSEEGPAPDERPDGSPAEPPPPPPEEPLPRWVSWSLAGAGMALGWLAAVATAEAWDANARAEAAGEAYLEAPSGSDEEALERDRHAEADSDYGLWSATALGAGVAGLGCAGAAIWLFLADAAAPEVGLAPLPGGAAARVGVTW